MKKHTFIFGALVLTVGGFIAKVIGAFYKIPLTNILGSTGMGIYYLVFPIYNLMLVFSSSGVSIAITRLVAEARTKKNKRNETKYFFAGVLVSFVLSLIFSGFIFAFAKPLAYFQGNVLSYLSFLAITPAIISASLVSVIRAYFQGIENMFPSTVAIIFEQITKLVSGLILSFKLLPLGLEYAVMGSVLAVSISETLTLIMMIINYIWHKKYNDNKFYVKDNNNRLQELKPNIKIKKDRFLTPNKIKQISTMYIAHENSNISFNAALSTVTKMMIPNTLMSMVMPLASLIDSFLVINLLSMSGYSSFTATSLYGINNGVVSSLISLPVIITSAIATTIVPNLSGLYSLNKTEEINKRSSFFIKITWLIILPIFIFFISMHDGIIGALYNFGANNVINEYGFACKILMISSVSFLYSAMLSTFISILQSINKSYQAFLILLSGLIIRVALTVVMLKIISLNIFGAIIANTIFLLYSSLMCLVVIRKNIDIQLNTKKTFIIPILISGVVYILLTTLKGLLYFLNVWLVLAITGIVCVAVYCAMIINTNCFDDGDFKYMPFLNKLKLFKKVNK